MIRVGPAGWKYPDWRGIVYPERLATGHSELRAIAELFGMVEVNSSFYAIPPARNAEKWVREVDAFPDFLFSAKLWQGFTHERELGEADIRAFRDLLMPLSAAGRLGAVLAQFPWSFRFNSANVEYLNHLLDAFGGNPLAVEFRHSGWQAAEAVELLRVRNVAFVNIDQPMLEGNLRPAEEVTSSLAYVRLHGRNSENWWAKEEAYYGARYDYLYSGSELAEWASRVRRISQSAQSTMIAMNNHFRGEAIINGLEIAALLGARKGPAPKSLARAYPGRLEAAGVPIQSADDEQQDLFS